MVDTRNRPAADPAVDNDGEWEDEAGLDSEDVLELAGQTNALLFTLMTHPGLNKANPLASPKPLFNVADFVRRTYLEYIIPLLPTDAPYKTREIANPFVFDYSTRPMPTAPNPAYLNNEANWPDLGDVKLATKYQDAIGRNVMISMAILDPEKGAATIGGSFEFGEHVKEVAGMILGGEDAEEKVRAKYAERGIDLSGH